MRAEAIRVALATAFLTIALLVALGLRPISVDRILAGYVLALAAIAVAALTRLAGARAQVRPESPFEHALRRRREAPQRPPELVRVEREIVLGIASAGHLHTRLLPLLREAAAVRLAERHGVDLERRPDAAHRLLGDEAWQYLRPDRPAPVDRVAPGISKRDAAAIVDALERL